MALTPVFLAAAVWIVMWLIFLRMKSRGCEIQSVTLVPSACLTRETTGGEKAVYFLSLSLAFAIGIAVSP